jgi:hypothetical protein
MYRFDSEYAGYPNIEAVLPVPASLANIPISPGFIVTAEDPVWGPGEFVYARVSAPIRIYGACQALPVWDVVNKVYTYNYLEWTATANISRPYYVWQGNRAAVAGEYGWFQNTGRSPIASTVSIAANLGIGHNAAGLATADIATFGVQGAITITPATQTVVSVGSGKVGDTRINLASTSGFIIGGYLSGTGVGAAAIVSYVDPLGRFVSATVVNSAAVSGNVTVTYNNGVIFYNVVEMNRMAGTDEA